ncbi:unnamed protein product [Ectocarpus sp. 8 AP-2014]
MGVLHYCYTLCLSLAEKRRGPTYLGRGVGGGGGGGVLFFWVTLWFDSSAKHVLS